jgi:hypothetical protein
VLFLLLDDFVDLVDRENLEILLRTDASDKSTGFFDGRPISFLVLRIVRDFFLKKRMLPEQFTRSRLAVQFTP